MLHVKLIVVGGHTEAKEFRLQLPLVIGRGRDSSIVIPHPLVSRRHCELFLQDGLLFVRDLSSLNGTYVGRDRIAVAELPPGGLLTVGTVTFRAVYAQAAEIGAPSAAAAAEHVDGDTVVEPLHGTHPDGFDQLTDRMPAESEAPRARDERSDTERSDWDTET